MAGEAAAMAGEAAADAAAMAGEAAAMVGEAAVVGDVGVAEACAANTAIFMPRAYMSRAADGLARVARQRAR